MRWSSALLFIAGNMVFASPAPSKRWESMPFLEKHSWSTVPQGWVYHSAPSPEHLLDMRIGLKKARGSELITTLYEVSTPSHERYGKHLSKEDVDALVAPHADSVEAVESWLRHHDVEPSAALFRSSGGNWLTVSVTVAQAERMLDTSYGVYVHPKTADTVVRTLGYSLPAELHDHIDLVAPTTYFSTLQSMRTASFIIEGADYELALAKGGSGKAIPDSCDTTITISCLQALYNTTGYVPTATDRNVLGVAGYLDEFASRADLQTFLEQYAPNLTGTTFDTVLVNGGGDDQNDPGYEANLDIQYTVGLSAPTPNIYYSTGGSPPFNPDSNTTTNTNEPYLDWLHFILEQDTIPQTISTSYLENEQTVPYDYAITVCELLAELGARGSTLFFCSGDYGVGGGDCKTNDGTNTTLFQPAFPASCPYVTAVGGTHLVEPEEGVYFSGGGFSRYFAQPGYQTAAVARYIDALDGNYTELYNPAGRAYPDLAAQGSAFSVILNGTVQSIWGTSASTPTVAAVFALLNDYRISNGLQPLGFINPLIYENAGGFNDIVAGSNPGCGTDGFAAVEGWDAITGLGTPDFLKLQPIVVPY